MIEYMDILFNVIDAQRIYSAIRLFYRFSGILMDTCSRYPEMKSSLLPSIILAIHFFILKSFFAHWTADNSTKDVEVWMMMNDDDDE